MQQISWITLDKSRVNCITTKNENSNLKNYSFEVICSIVEKNGKAKNTKKHFCAKHSFSEN